MSSKEDYLDNLLQTVSNETPSGETAIQKLAGIQDGENQTGTEKKAESEEVDYDDDEEIELDFPELDSLFEEAAKQSDTQAEQANNTYDVPGALENIALDGEKQDTLPDLPPIEEASGPADSVSSSEEALSPEETEKAEQDELAALAESLQGDMFDDSAAKAPALPQEEEQALPQQEAESASKEAITGTDDLSGMDLSDLEALMDVASSVAPEQEQTENLPDSLDVTDLLSAMDDDGDLAEISELLRKSDQNEVIEEKETETVAPSLEQEKEHSDGEEASANDEPAPQAALGKLWKKKREKKPKKEKQSKQKANSEGAALKKPGFFKKMLSFLMDDENETDAAADEKQQLDLSQENIDILNAIEREDAKAAKKKKKQKEKKPKKEKIKKEKIKKEKVKKPKKEKAPKPPKEPEMPLKPIGKKKIAITVCLALTVFGMIWLFTSYIPAMIEKRAGREAFSEGNYQEAYDLLIAKEVKGAEETALKGATLCLQMERKLDSYAAYKKLDGMELEQLDALISGVEKYQKIYKEAEKYGVASQVQNSYLNILGILDEEYGVSEQAAKEIAALNDKVAYTKELRRILGIETAAAGAEQEQ